MRTFSSLGTGHKFVDLGSVVDYYYFPEAKPFEGEVPLRKEVGLRCKRMDSMFRAKKRVQWLIECNRTEGQEWFFTGTFSEEVKDFSDATAAWERFRRLLIKEFPNCRYVVVPELQPVSRRWHFHAVIFQIGSRGELLSRYAPQNRVGGVLPGFVHWFQVNWARANGHVVDSLGRGGDRIDIQEVRSVGALAHYLTKYLNKTLGNEVPSDRRCYFAGGRDLRRPVVRRYSNYEPSLVGYVPCGKVVYMKEFESRFVGKTIVKRFVKPNDCEEKNRMCGCYDDPVFEDEVIPMPEMELVEEPWYNSF